MAFNEHPENMPNLDFAQGRFDLLGRLAGLFDTFGISDFIVSEGRTIEVVSGVLHDLPTDLDEFDGQEMTVVAFTGHNALGDRVAKYSVRSISVGGRIDLVANPGDDEVTVHALRDDAAEVAEGDATTALLLQKTCFTPDAARRYMKGMILDEPEDLDRTINQLEDPFAEWLI